MKTTGFSVSLGKQLKWPDDYFSLIHTLNFTQYNLKNYPIFSRDLIVVLSTNVSFKIALQRNSAGPIRYSLPADLISWQVDSLHHLILLFNKILKLRRTHTDILSFTNGDLMQNGMCQLVSQWVQKRTGSLC